MNDTANSEGLLIENEKPVITPDEVKFPPFPEPTDKDFEDDVPEEERIYYKNKFPDLNVIKCMRLHCTSCDRHLGSASRNVTRMRAHPMLRTLVCHTCHTFYNSGEFEKGDDGSELYCRWCGQGGQVYCCSNCPHVFCAKCIKRNFGTIKIKEIESTDDWKCLKCSPECLKDLRALCWATLRYCDLKNEITYKTEDPKLKEIYQKDCAHDYTECCKHKYKRKEKEPKKKESEHHTRKQAAASIISKIPSTIQVKKFASINADDTPKPEKKATKRPASPKNNTFFMKNPVAIASGPRLLNPIGLPPPMKKLKMPTTPLISTVRYINEARPMATYSRLKPRPTVPAMPMISNFNGFNNPRHFSNVNMVPSDNINLSLENLTQGLDMASMAAMSNDNQNAVVCTPDFPMEPLCEVTEDNDDDVQCISPDPVMTNKISNPPPLVPRGNSLPDLSSDNIIQMTENDVTVNLVTGGLKFRVDPQTLSSNKMYRLPDGRVFAIKANPNMPGGYSATIVAVTENAKAPTPQGATFAAKLSAVSNVHSSTPVTKKRNQNRPTSTKRCDILRKPKVTTGPDSMSRECDLSVPVEWYRYNLIDAVDALEYSLTRLNKLKKEATTMFLRTRNINEMRNLHRTLERLLNTSSNRFTEIRENLNRELKQYIMKKKEEHISDDDDDDDVEILPDLENDDPIFIDENSLDSNVVETQEVDLTETCNSENNDSGEKADSSRLGIDPLTESVNSTIVNSSEELVVNHNNNDGKNESNEDKIDKDDNTVKQVSYENDLTDKEKIKETDTINTTLICDESLNAGIAKNQFTDGKQYSKEIEGSNYIEQASNDKENLDNKHDLNENASSDAIKEELNNKVDSDVNPDSSEKVAFDAPNQESNEKETCDDACEEIPKRDGNHNNDEKMQDSEMGSELIETLLKDDNEDNVESISQCLDIPDLQDT